MRSATATARLAPTPAWLDHPGVRRVIAGLTADGARARFVGGCVRNAMLASEGAPATDVDVAVDRPPTETTRLLLQAGLKAAPTGFEHGTVTTIAETEAGAGSFPIEVTSLRRDVATDGRRAVVAYTEDWAEDAARRDFTINALYADADGAVFDPIGAGLADLAARRVRFIGRAADRIQEDYLRILRFFRFYAWYGAAGGLDPNDVEATRRWATGVDGLARERVGAEVRKLFAAPDPTVAAAEMARAGVSTRILPGHEADAEALRERLAHTVAEERRMEIHPCWALRLTISLAGPSLDLPALTSALRLSRSDVARLSALNSAAKLPAGEAAYRHGRAAAEGALLWAAARNGRAIDSADLAAARRGGAATMPIGAQDLMENGAAPGPALGAALRRAERLWIDSGFTAAPAALLAAAAERDRM